MADGNMHDDITDDDIAWERLDRYFAGECTPAERARLERWVGNDGARAERLASARRIWEVTGVVPADLMPAHPVPKRFDVDAAWQRVGGQMMPGTAGASRTAGSRTHSRRPSARVRAAMPRDRSLAYAAAAALVLLAGGALTWQAAARGWLAPAHGPTPPPREYATARGQRATFELRDGTRVILGVASRLTVPASYGRPGAPRDVMLDGEAYFEVRHDSTAHFRVRTADALTEDVGTAFAVRAYRGDAGAEVAVADGRVIVHPGAGPGDGRGTLLSRGQVAKIPSGGPIAVIDVPDLTPYTGWTQGRLVFKDTPLAEALPRLGRWFDLDFRLADPALASRHLTAMLAEQPTREVLDLLALSLGVRQERHGKVVTLYPLPADR